MMTNPITGGGRAPHIVRRGTGVPLLLVHGMGVDHRIMLDLDASFAPGWERIYPDLPGFGATPRLPEPGGLPEFADWLDALVEDLIGQQPFAIAGASVGGLLAREIAARRRELCQGMALVAPVIDPVRENRTLPVAEVLVRDDALLASLDPQDASDYADFAVVQSRENWERFQAAVLPGLRAADPVAWDQLAARYALDELPDDRLEGFDRPVLMATGRQDAIVGYTDQWTLAQRMPHATFAVLDRAGHNLGVDQPDAVAALLGEWSAAALAGAARS